MKEWAHPLIVSMIVAFGVAGFTTGIVSCDEQKKKDTQRVEQYKIKNSCFVTGFYGRSGEYRVYDCNGLIIKEQDL